MKLKLIFLILVLFSINFSTRSTELEKNKKLPTSPSSKFLSEQLKKDGILESNAPKPLIDKEFVSGLISLSIGTIGYFTTNSDTIKLAYSGAQSLGIISIGSSIRKSYYPSLDKLYLDVANLSSPSTNELSDVFLKNYGLRDRANRMTRLYNSGLLALQYGTSAFIDNPGNEIKKIYAFLFGVNVLVFSHSYLFRSPYEQKSSEFNLLVRAFNNDDPNSYKPVPGIALTYQW